MPVRGSGRTTALIKASPPDAYFFVRTHWMMDYTRRLAQHLGRSDLKIRFLDPLDNYVLETKYWSMNREQGFAADHDLIESMSSATAEAFSRLCQRYEQYSPTRRPD